jgi:tetratricopeptide (TPR) repeat protein
MNQKLLPLLLVLAVIATYLGVFTAEAPEFVFDDIRFVVDNAAIRDLGNTGAFFTDLKTVDVHGWGGIYRPLRTLDFALDWAISGTWGDEAKILWYHFRNILYHAAAVLLAWLLFRRWGAGDVGAALGALVFALHPVQVESVAWITSRADVLYLVLFLGALWLHGGSVGFDRRFLGASALLALALLAKEAAVVFVGAAVLSDFFFRDDRRIGATFRRWPKYLVYAALAVAYFLIWKYLHDAAEEDWWHTPVRWGGSLAGTLWTMARGFVYYARLVLLPVDMAQDWYLLPVTGPDPLTIVCAIAIAGTVLAALILAFRRGGWFAFAVLWFLIGIFPASNLPAPIGITTAERFLYLPMVGIAAAFGVLLARVWRTGRPMQAGVITVLFCLAAVSFERTEIWTTNKALWLTTLERFESPRALDWLGKRDRIRGEAAIRRSRILADEDRTEDAKRMAERGKELLEIAIANYDRQMEIWQKLPDPRGPIALTRAQRSICLSDLGRHQEALEEADRVLFDWPDHYRGHGARALALYGLGRFREAAREIERAIFLRDNPADRKNAAAIYEKLAMLYGQAGNKAQAFIALQKSWEYFPDEERNHEVYRAWKEAERDFVQIRRPYEERVDRNKGDWAAWLELANIYATYGFYEQAGQIYHELLGSENPTTGNPNVLFQYAKLFWQTRDTEEGYEKAAEYYDLILEMVPDHPNAPDERAFCLRELDRLRAMRGYR